MNRTVIFSILALALAFVAAIYGGIVTGQFDSQKIQTAADNTTALIGGDFTLTDQHNEPVTQDALLGHYSLVTFGYTFCPDICPVVQQTIAAALDNLGPLADGIVPYLITIDPARDTVEVMAEYSKHFHPSLVAMTGTPEQIAQAASVFRIFYGRVSEPEDTEFYLMEHSSVIYVMGPDGKYIAHFTHATPMDEMVQRLKEIL
ncbi:MAG: SCO family protein [Alphaproteobacteria bacterium]|nr:SCO family protein [Alphaproteobacteria bacterium]MBT5859540.1 SCO family protein [Alphaproteobacteria bacterium]